MQEFVSPSLLICARIHNSHLSFDYIYRWVQSQFLPRANPQRHGLLQAQLSALFPDCKLMLGQSSYPNLMLCLLTSIENVLPCFVT